MKKIWDRFFDVVSCERVLIICMNYGFTGLNFLISNVLKGNPTEAYYKISIILGLVFLGMVPLSYFDKRKEMRGGFNMVLSSFAHCVLSVCISYFYFSWFTMIIYVFEVAVSVGVVTVKFSKNQKK